MHSILQHKFRMQMRSASLANLTERFIAHANELNVPFMRGLLNGRTANARVRCDVCVPHAFLREIAYLDVINRLHFWLARVASNNKDLRSTTDHTHSTSPQIKSQRKTYNLLLFVYAFVVCVCSRNCLWEFYGFAHLIFNGQIYWWKLIVNNNICQVNRASKQHISHLIKQTQAQIVLMRCLLFTLDWHTNWHKICIE